MTSAVLPIAVQSAHAWTAGAPVDLGTVLSLSAALSSSGDFAADTFNDPWDFSNPEDARWTRLPRWVYRALRPASR